MRLSRRHPAAERSESSLKVAAAAGARWTAASTAVLVAAHFVQLAVLARLLTPRDFGLAAAASVVVGLAGRLGDAGINNAIIAKQTSDRNVLSSLYWANIIVGVVITALVVASIPLATAYFGEPDLAGLLLLAAPASLIAPLGQQYQVLLQKELDFRPLATTEAVSSVLGAAGAVALAVGGAGAASLIGGFLIQTTVKALWLAIRGWSISHPHWRLRRKDLSGYLSFGMYQLAERAMNYVGSNLDYALIGGFLGARALGTYSLAFRLVKIPQMRLNPILTRVAFPVFARRQDNDAAMCRGYLQVSRLIAFVSFPLMAGFAASAPQLVPVIFGPQWDASVPILRVLAIAGVFFSLANLNGSVFLAKDRPDLGVKINVVRLSLLLGVLPVALEGGTIAVAWAFTAVSAAMFIVTRIVLGKLIGLSMASYLRALQHPAAASAAMAGAVMAATPALEAWFASGLAVLGAQAAGGALVYGACTAILARTWAIETWRLMVHGRPGRSSLASTLAEG